MHPYRSYSHAMTSTDRPERKLFSRPFRGIFSRLVSRWPWGLPIGALLTGCLLLRWSWAVLYTHPWESNTLTNIGVAFLLLAPAAFYAEWHRTALRRVETKTDEAKEASQQATTIAEGNRAEVEVLSGAVERLTGAKAIEEELRQEAVAGLKQDMALFERWGETADRSSTTDALGYAYRVGMVSASGYRAPIFETTLHLRFSYDAPSDDLELTVEHNDATPVGSVEWAKDQPPTEVYRAIEAIIADSGQQPSSVWTLSIHAVEHAAASLRYAVLQRATRIMHGDNFRDLVEFLGDSGEDEQGWYIADYGIFPREHQYYVITTERLDEPLGPETQWEDHLRNKGWYGAPRALRVARALRSTREPEAVEDTSDAETS